MHLIVDVAEVDALEMSSQRRENRHRHRCLEIILYLAGEQLDELRQLGRQLGRNFGVDSCLLGGLLGEMILAGKLHRLLHELGHFRGLSHLAGALYRGERLLLVFAEDFDYLLNPSRLAIADVSEQAGFTIDEVVAVAMGRSAAHQIHQRLHNLLVRNAIVGLLILHGIGSPSRLLLLALDRLEIYGWSGINIHRTAVDVQSSLSVSLTIFSNSFLIQVLVPVVGSIDLAGSIGDEDDALRRNAAGVFGGMDELAEGALSLSDGHPYRDADVDVGLVACRAFYVKHFPPPKLDFIGGEHLLTGGFLLGLIKHSVQEQGSLHGSFYLLRIIDVYGSLEGEGLRVDGLLGTVVVQEVEVVRRTERQLLLEDGNLSVELLVGLSLLLLLAHQILLGGKVANLPHEGAEPGLLGELGVVIEEISSNLPHVCIAIRVHGNETAAHLLAFIKRKIVVYHLNII